MQTGKKYKKTGLGGQEMTKKAGEFSNLVQLVGLGVSRQ
jgi:hypothetical protein